MVEESLDDENGFIFNNNYHEIFDHVKEHAIFMLDPKGNIKSWNKAAHRIKGYTKEEIIGKHFSIFYSQDLILEGFPEFVLSEAVTNGTFEYEGWRMKKDGSRFWAKIVIEALHDDKGEVVGFMKICRDITPLKSEDTLLKESEDRYRILVESIKEYAVFMLNPQGKISTWNSGAEKIYGYKEKQIVGKHFSVFYDQETVEAGYPEYEISKAISDGEFTDEGWRVKRDGSLFFANVLLKPIYDKNKKLLGFSKVTKDLTEQKQHEHFFKENEDLFKLLIENISDYAIIMLDRNGIITTWNKGASRIKGYSEQEVLGKHFSIFYTRPNIDEKVPDKELEQALKDGKFFGEGWRVRNKGRLYWAKYILAPLYNHRKELLGFYKITRDLTERKKTQKELFESEERYKLLINSIKDYAIFILDTKGYITTWNSGAEKIKGYKAEEIIGKHFSIFYPDEAIRSGHPEYELTMAIKEGKYEEESWRLKKDGSMFWVNVMISPIYNAENVLIGFSKITRDLTERKMAEDKLKMTITDLDNFIYTASHDLKSPVTNLEGLVNLLLNEVNQDNEKVRKLLNMVNLSINKFKETISDLTEISRIQRIVEDDVEPVDIQEFVDEFLMANSLLISENNAQIKVDFQVKHLSFSRKNLRSILTNLLTNAIKYRHRNRQPEITVKTRKEKDYILLSVQDNGLGLKKHEVPKVFQMFKRLHDHVSGTGIGLYIVKRIVDNTGGKIEVDTSLKEGTIFNVYLKEL